ncbi:PGF-pre-PGF domain-containing protein [Candidatus Woesearchaeota archaeon]|nr:PGF-pre-PGF domain-containing protein [Candidatus Woesearchaeota archaeon]
MNLIFLSTSVFAVPLPHGIDGTVYELDGITQVPSTVMFSVNDTTSGYFISGYVGRGKNTGKYSVVINGEDNDVIEIMAWNREHIANRTVVLKGVMHNISLTLNMTYANNAPNITSTPVVNATVGVLYWYDVEAVDADNDILNYSLLHKPDGMNMDSYTGVITWTPTFSQVGENNITVRVSDGFAHTEQSFCIYVNQVINHNPEIVSEPILTVTEDTSYKYQVEAFDEDNDTLRYYLIARPVGMSINQTDGMINWLPTNDNVGSHYIMILVIDSMFGSATQEYNLTVLNVNDPPEIVSEPKTTAYLQRLYFYDVDAVDPDNDNLVYSLLESPDGMRINRKTGWLMWVPRTNPNTWHKVIVQASDGEFSATQEFEIYVIRTKKNWFKKEKNIFTVSPEEDMAVVNVKFYTEQDLEDMDINIGILSQKPKEIESIPKKVYKYLRFEKDREFDFDKVIIEFKVLNGWLNDYKIYPEDITLYRYLNDWTPLSTKLTSIENEYTYYEAESSGFSYFAIIAEKAEYAEPEIDEDALLKNPFVILGEVYYKDGEPLDENMEFSLVNNRTKQEVHGETGLPNSNNYQAVIHGNKDDIAVISMGENDQKVISLIKLTGDVIKKDILLNITKEEYQKLKKRLSNKILIISIVLLNLGVLAVVGYRTFKNEK